MLKNTVARQATDDIMTHAHFMLIPKATDALGMRNTYCFFTTVAARKRLSVRLYVY